MNFTHLSAVARGRVFLIQTHAECAARRTKAALYNITVFNTLAAARVGPGCGCVWSKRQTPGSLHREVLLSSHTNFINPSFADNPRRQLCTHPKHSQVILSCCDEAAAAGPTHALHQHALLLNFPAVI